MLLDKNNEDFLKDKKSKPVIRERLEGTSHEVAFIDDDGTLYISYFEQKDYQKDQKFDTIPPDDSKYREFCTRYGLKKTGDIKGIVRRFVDEKWVETDK